MRDILTQFRASEPAQWDGALLALWWAGRGDWDRAHEIAQATEDRDGAWVHAMLHRQEGDGANAAYWYRRAGRPVAAGATEDEWAEIVQALTRG